MKKLISVLTVMMILFASVWCMLPVMAAQLPVLPENTQDVGGCADHTFGEWSVPTDATCTVASYVTRTCKDCGFVEVEKYAEKLGHAPAAGYVFDEKNGTHSFTCLNCKEQFTQECTLVLDSTDYQCATIVKNTYHCEVCGNSLVKEEAPTHIVAEWTLVPNSVQHSGVCSGCGETVYANCEMVEKTITATCENGGQRILECVCGRTSSESVAALGHNVEAWLHIEGTEIHAGKCTRCLASPNYACTITGYKADPVAEGSVALTHTGSCSVCLAPYTKDCKEGTYVSVAGTASHQTNCLDCGRNFTNPCKPDASGLKSNNNGTHTATCAVCASAYTVACTPSAYTHVENTETHSTVCTECDGTYTEVCEVKTWTPSQKVNAETGEVENGDLHKGNCTKCSAEYEKDCTVETYTLDVDGKTCTGTCTACGDTLIHESTLGAWKYDAEKNTHTIECTTCKASASHTVAVAENGWKHVEAAGDSCHEAACTVCNTVELAACEFENDAENVHKHTCKVCAFSYEDECVNFVKDKDNSTAATCTEDGYTYYNCKDCGKRNETKTLVHKAHGHEFVVDEEAEIISTNESHTVTYICKNCNETETKTEEHTFGKAKAEKDGKHSFECTVCGKIKSENCKAVKIPAVAADCTNAGLTEGSKCSVCGTILKEQTKTSALGHDYKYHSTTATCSKAGKDIFKCICGETKEVAAAANGKHEWKATSRVPATAEANGYVEYTCKYCDATYREVLVYSVHTGLGNALTPVAAIVLLSGVAFIGVKKLRKDEE